MMQSKVAVGVPPRHAATMIVVDASGPVPRVLMGRRSSRARFMPSHDVFPGGAVDPGDFGADTATALPELARAHLHRAADPALAQALAVAACRELQEETGLSLGRPPALAGLRYLCRAVTPADWAIRFDARFLVVDRLALTTDLPDARLAGDGELGRLAWQRLDDRACLRLSKPTRAALDLLSARLSGASAWPADPDTPLPVLLRDGLAWSWE